MSFSGTPLGQGRRLDRDTFLGKPTSNGHRPTSPHQSIPTSYTYGAPTFGSRSPPKPSSPIRDRNKPSNIGDEENETALARFARQKQREAELASRPGGPKVITSPPKPERWNVKDTTVNIATAFTQAANDMMPSHNNPNNSWASSSSRNVSHVPRSTSVEYEKEAQSTQARRLAAPPNRHNNRGPISGQKSPSKSASLQQVPDSEGEEGGGRAKSPLEQVLDAATRALAPTTFYMRPRSQEPEEPSIEQPSINGNHSINGSYDYEAEEQAFQAEQAERRAHKRNKMSVDNKAYKPTESDMESEDEYTEERRRGKGKQAAAGRMTKLPTIVEGKSGSRKRKSRGSKGKLVGKAEEGEEEDAESEGNSYTDIQSQSAQARSSVQRTSVAPIPEISIEYYDTMPDQSMDAAEQGLQSIPEVPQEQLQTNAANGRGKTPQVPLRKGRGKSRAATPSPHSSQGFSIGIILGTLVHYIFKWTAAAAVIFIQILSSCFFLCGRVLGTIYDVMINRPWRWILNSYPGLLFVFGKYIFLGLTIFSAWYALQDQDLRSYLPVIPIPSLPSRSSPIYTAPEIPAANIAELAERLSRIEFALSGLSLENERTKAKADDGAKGYLELLNRLGSVEGRLTSESRRISDSESRARDTLGKGINGVKQEIEVLQAQILTQQRKYEKEKETSTEAADEEARVKLRALEERVGSVEGGVKEALDLGKKLGSAPAPTSPGPGATWWNKIGSSKSTLQIKSSDGQDVTDLISHLVDSAVSLVTKDGIAKPDFALHSGGARVIPSLTSPTLEIRPTTLRSQLLGVVTGNGYAIGRPPITALHHEQHNGHCWPFAGSQGQLGVALAAPIYVEEITIDHVAREVAFDMRNAPREMEVWGMIEGQDNIDRLKAWREAKEARKTEAGEIGVDVDDKVPYPATLPKDPEYIRIANFTYDIYAWNNVQTFPVDAEVREMGIDFGIVVLRVLGNWGREELTCLYRFRAHGENVGQAPPPYPDQSS